MTNFIYLRLVIGASFFWTLSATRRATALAVSEHRGQRNLNNMA